MSAGLTRFSLTLHGYNARAASFHWSGGAPDARSAYAMARRDAGLAFKAMLAITGAPDGEADPKLLACATRHGTDSAPTTETDQTTWRLGGALIKLKGGGDPRTGAIPSQDEQLAIAMAMGLTDPALAAHGADKGFHLHAGRTHAHKPKTRLGHEIGTKVHSRTRGLPYLEEEAHDPLTRAVLLTLAMASACHKLTSAYSAGGWPPESATLAAAHRVFRARAHAPALLRAAEALEAIGTMDLADGVRKRLKAL